jgi:hypothetical protein
VQRTPKNVFILRESKFSKQKFYDHKTLHIVQQQILQAPITFTYYLLAFIYITRRVPTTIGPSAQCLCLCKHRTTDDGPIGV